MNTDTRTLNLSHNFLIASPQLNDSFFAGAVVYLCEHNADGAMGVMINKPSPVRMAQLFEASDSPMPAQFAEKWVLIGGPAQIDRGFLLHSPADEWQSTLKISDDIALTTSRDLIEALQGDYGDNIRMLATIGYCTWTAGQLEQEIADAGWLTVPADKEILFESPYFRRYDDALKKLGIRAVNLAGDIGHA